MISDGGAAQGGRRAQRLESQARDLAAEGQWKARRLAALERGAHMKQSTEEIKLLKQRKSKQSYTFLLYIRKTGYKPGCQRH